MPRRIFSFDPPDRFQAGTIGEPGQRAFFLQATRGSQVVSVALEKIQVAAMAQRLAEMLATLRGRGVAIPDEAPEEDPVEPLAEPLNEQFQVGTLTLGWEAERLLLTVEARALVEEDEEGAEQADDLDDDPDGPDVLRVWITPTAALAFVRRAVQVVAAGRPLCPMCGQPLNPEGHLCPRRNGYVH